MAARCASAIPLFTVSILLLLFVLNDRSQRGRKVIIHASSALGSRPEQHEHPTPRPRIAADALDAIQVEPPVEAPDIAWLHGPPTPLADLRKAAAHYFPDMIDSSERALPQVFDETAVNPCWGASYCLPSFLILGVYQSGVRDLYMRLTMHSKIAPRPATSPSFYSQVHPTWPEYVDSLVKPSRKARAHGQLLGEASAVTFHFIWVHQEKFNQPYVNAMGSYWKACNARTAAAKAVEPHRDCMGKRMVDGRRADAAQARKAGLPMIPDDPGNQTARERAFSVPQLMRAVYGEYAPALIVLLRLPWHRMHASFFNYPHYSRRFGASAEGETTWALESVSAFRRCVANFTADQCALSFESLTRDNEEVFYHCDQLIKGMYSVFLKRWQKEFTRLLVLRAEDYHKTQQPTLARVLRFLNLQVPADQSQWSPMLTLAVQRAGSRPKGGLPSIPTAMLKALREFYAPTLKELLELLRDEQDIQEWAEWTRRV